LIEQRPFEALRATIQAVVRKFGSTIGNPRVGGVRSHDFEWLVQRTLPTDDLEGDRGFATDQVDTNIKRGRTEIKSNLNGI